MNNYDDKNLLLWFFATVSIFLKNTGFIKIITWLFALSHIFQVLQESLSIPHTNVHLVYHSSESAGYMSVIMIQMTPSTIPDSLAVVHLKVSVEGIVMEKVFEADPNLKYTFSWNRRNVYRQKVYGIVTARGNILIKFAKKKFSVFVFLVGVYLVSSGNLILEIFLFFICSW